MHINPADMRALADALSEHSKMFNIECPERRDLDDAVIKLHYLSSLYEMESPLRALNTENDGAIRLAPSALASVLRPLAAAETSPSCAPPTVPMRDVQSGRDRRHTLPIRLSIPTQFHLLRNLQPGNST